MKYVFLLTAVLAVYCILTRSAPVKPAVQAVTQQEAAPLTTGPRDPSPASSSLKKPFDRTHEVLDQVRQRNGNGEF
jgi:hypothetical protein